MVLDSGNLGHNKDNSYRSKYPKLVEKSITFFRRLGEYGRLFLIFPLDAPKFFVYAKDYDMASQVIGILRIRIDNVDQWLGNGQLLSQDNLFPNAMNDYGYDLLLQLPDDFIPKNFSIAKYV